MRERREGIGGETERERCRDSGKDRDKGREGRGREMGGGKKSIGSTAEQGRYAMLSTNNNNNNIINYSRDP